MMLLILRWNKLRWCIVSTIKYTRAQLIEAFWSGKRGRIPH